MARRMVAPEEVESLEARIKVLEDAPSVNYYMHNIHIDDGVADWYFNTPSSNGSEADENDFVDFLTNIYGTNKITSAYGNLYDLNDNRITDIAVTPSGVTGYYDNNGTMTSISIDFDNIVTFNDDIKDL